MIKFLGGSFEPGTSTQWHAQRKARARASRGQFCSKLLNAGTAVSTAIDLNAQTGDRIVATRPILGIRKPLGRGGGQMGKLWMVQSTAWWRLEWPMPSYSGTASSSASGAVCRTGTTISGGKDTHINPRTCCSASPSNHLYSAEVNGQPHTHRTYSDGTVELESW